MDGKYPTVLQKDSRYHLHLFKCTYKITNTPIFFVIQCCLLFSMMPPEIVGQKIEPQGLFNAVNILLSLQVIQLHAYKCLYIFQVSY